MPRIEVHHAEASAIMAASDCGLVTSGTATLQAALAEMPHVVVYALDRLTWLFARRCSSPSSWTRTFMWLLQTSWR